MKIGELSSESSDSCLLPSLPEDVVTIISRFLDPSDICNLILCCKSLYDLVDSEKIWLVQCEVLKVLPLSELIHWRIGIFSYKILCRFLVDVVKPLVGIWVHQNPELGNVVYVMPGFLSVIACRIIPQEVSPLGIQEGQIMWSPVFEIICGFNGSTKFFLHGRDEETSCLYPGFVTGIEKSCNVLLLEVEPRRREKSLCSELSFCKLAFSDRRKLLDVVTSHIGLHVPEKLFLDKPALLEHRTMLLKMHKFGKNWNHMNLEDELCYEAILVSINKVWKNLGFRNMEDESTQRKSFSKYFRNGLKQILRRSSSSSSSRNGIRRYNLQTF